MKCPRARILHPVRRLQRGQVFVSRVSDCAYCPLKNSCLPASRANQEVVIPHDYPALLRARRRRARWSADDRRLYQRHLWRSEGFHGEAKTWHGLDNMKIQAYLTAAAINLKRLATALRASLWALWTARDAETAPSGAGSRPHQPNQPPSGRCHLVRRSPRSKTGFFNNLMRGSFHRRHLPGCAT